MKKQYKDNLITNLANKRSNQKWLTHAKNIHSVHKGFYCFIHDYSPFDFVFIINVFENCFNQKIKSINNSREYGSELGWVPSRNKSGCESEILEHDKYTLKYPDLSFDIEFVWHDYGGISELDGDYIDLIYPHNIPLWSGMKNSKMNNIPGCDTCYGSLYNHIRYYNRNLSVHFDYKNGVNDNDQEKEFKILLDALKCIESSIDEYYKKHDESPNKKNDQQPNP